MMKWINSITIVIVLLLFCVVLLSSVYSLHTKKLLEFAKCTHSLMQHSQQEILSASQTLSMSPFNLYLSPRIFTILTANTIYSFFTLFWILYQWICILHTFLCLHFKLNLFVRSIPSVMHNNFFLYSYLCIVFHRNSIAYFIDLL